NADGGALFTVTLANPAPAYAFYLERVDARGRALWGARFDTGFRAGDVSHHLLDVRFVKGGATELLYARSRSLALGRYGPRGALLGAANISASLPNGRDFGCGAILDARTIVTLEQPGGESPTDIKLLVLAWHGAGKGKLRERRIMWDDERYGVSCKLFAMD